MDPVRRLELVVLRPLWVLVAVSGAILAIKGHWAWAGAGVPCLVYLGIIGAKLHPLQGLADLAAGPLTSDAARAEAVSLSIGMKRVLASHACSRVAIFLGIAAGAISVGVLGIAWYWGLIIGFFGMSIAGGILKFVFVRPTR